MSDFKGWSERVLKDGCVLHALIGQQKRYGQPRATAEDWAMDGILKALSEFARESKPAEQSVGEGKPVESYEHFENWVRQRASRRLTDRYRKEKRIKAIEQLATKLVDPAGVLPDQERAERVEAIASVLADCLSDYERELVDRHYGERGQTFEEIARDLDRRPGTVYGHWQRMLDRLRRNEQLKELAREMGIKTADPQPNDAPSNA